VLDDFENEDSEKVDGPDEDGQEQEETSYYRLIKMSE